MRVKESIKHWTKVFIFLVLAMIAAAICQANAREMTFEIFEQGYTNGKKTAAIFADGDIVEGTRDKLKQLIEEEQISKAVIYFNSTGGLVIESIRLGQYIRSKGFGTSVKSYAPVAEPAMCASACVYAYAGGVARYLEDADGKIGVHQYYSARKDGDKVPGRDDLKVAQLLGSLIVAHLEQMGVSSALYVAAAMTDSSDMLWMNRSDAQTYDLVNDGELPPNADIRLTDEGVPYLQISQIADKGQTHIIIMCDHTGIFITSGAISEQRTVNRTMAQAVSNAITIDDKPVKPLSGHSDISAIEDNGIQTMRFMDLSYIPQINAARKMGFVIEGISGKWTREIDVSGLSDKIAYYTRTCANRK